MSCFQRPEPSQMTLNAIPVQREEKRQLRSLQVAEENGKYRHGRIDVNGGIVADSAPVCRSCL